MAASPKRAVYIGPGSVKHERIKPGNGTDERRRNRGSEPATRNAVIRRAIGWWSYRVADDV